MKKVGVFFNLCFFNICNITLLSFNYYLFNYITIFNQTISKINIIKLLYLFLPLKQFLFYLTYSILKKQDILMCLPDWYRMHIKDLKQWGGYFNFWSLGKFSQDLSTNLRNFNLFMNEYTRQYSLTPKDYNFNLLVNFNSDFEFMPFTVNNLNVPSIGFIDNCEYRTLLGYSYIIIVSKFQDFSLFFFKIFMNIILKFKKTSYFFKFKYNKNLKLKKLFTRLYSNQRLNWINKTKSLNFFKFNKYFYNKTLRIMRRYQWKRSFRWIVRKIKFLRRKKFRFRFYKKKRYSRTPVHEPFLHKYLNLHYQLSIKRRQRKNLLKKVDLVRSDFLKSYPKLTTNFVLKKFKSIYKHMLFKNGNFNIDPTTNVFEQSVFFNAQNIKKFKYKNYMYLTEIFDNYSFNSTKFFNKDYFIIDRSLKKRKPKHLRPSRINLKIGKFKIPLKKYTNKLRKTFVFKQRIRKFISKPVIAPISVQNLFNKLQYKKLMTSLFSGLKQFLWTTGKYKHFLKGLKTKPKHTLKKLLFKILKFNKLRFKILKSSKLKIYVLYKTFIAHTRRNVSKKRKFRNNHLLLKRKRITRRNVSKKRKFRNNRYFFERDRRIQNRIFKEGWRTIKVGPRSVNSFVWAAFNRKDYIMCRFRNNNKFRNNKRSLLTFKKSFCKLMVTRASSFIKQKSPKTLSVLKKDMLTNKLINIHIVKNLKKKLKFISNIINDSSIRKLSIESASSCSLEKVSFNKQYYYFTTKFQKFYKLLYFKKRFRL